MLRLGLLTTLFLLLAPAAFSQTVAGKPLPTEPLEKYDNAPAIAAPIKAISPALISQFDSYTSYQVNVDANGNNIVGDAANEPSICIDRNNPNRMSVGWRQFDSVASNFREAGFAYTTNGGTRWIAPGVLQNNIFRSDPVLNSPAWGTLDVDSAGNLFIGGVNFNTGRIWCVRSINAKNGGVVPTFDQSTAVNFGGDIVFAEPINPEGLVGQVFLAVDRSGTSTNDNVYMLASVQPFGFTSGSDVMFARSTDGGRTFSAPRRINDDPVNHAKWHWFGTLSVAPSGRIDAVWYDMRNSPNNGTSQLFYSYSTDGGDSWSANVAVTNPFNPSIGYPNQQKIGDYITVISDNAS